MHTTLRRSLAAAMLAAAATAPPATAQTEFHYQLGQLDNPFGGASARTQILTFQQAQPWALGDSFYFIDFLNDEREDGFNNQDLYGEWYPTLSVRSLASAEAGAGALRDVSFIGGVNFFGGDVPFLKYLPGVRASWNAPGFVFLNTDLTAFIDGTREPAGVPNSPNGWMFDVSWGAPFDIGAQSFWFTGHAEYIHNTILPGVTTELPGWILAQPQLGWDLGKAATGRPDRLYLGVEYQLWQNKLGTDHDENTVQMWLMWRL